MRTCLLNITIQFSDLRISISGDVDFLPDIGIVMSCMKTNKLFSLYIYFCILLALT